MPRSSSAWSAGIQGYYFKDQRRRRPGARLGPFEGEVTTPGGAIAHNFVAVKIPVSLRLKVMQDFGAKNRLERTSVLLTLVTPVKRDLPRQ